MRHFRKKSKTGHSLSHEMFRTFLFANIIGFPRHRNKRKSVLGITKMYYFYIQIIKLVNKK